MERMINFQRAWRMVVLASLAGLLAACASTPQRPTAALQSARQAISNAEEARAGEHAPLELRKARDRLAAANDAVDSDNMLAAERLAEEAAVLAELAFARSEMLTARRVNDELERTTEMFKEELQRKPGVTS